MMFPVIIDQAGPLPIKATVQWPSTNTVILAVSGSAYAQNPGTMLRVRVNIKNTWIGSIQVFANQASTHLTLPTGFLATNGEYGEFTLSLTADGGTVTDQNDRFTVALLY